MSSSKRVLPILLLLVVGCGPVRSTIGVVDAERAYQEAAAAGAEQAAPYPYELAGRLLDQARDEQGYADWGESFRLAGEAQKYAEQALNAARSAPQPPGLAAPEDTAPPAADEGAVEGPPASEAADPQATPAADPEATPAADPVAAPAADPATDPAADPEPAPAADPDPEKAPQ